MRASCTSIGNLLFYIFNNFLDVSLPTNAAYITLHCCFVSVMAAGWSPCGHRRIYCLCLWCHKSTRITNSHSSHIIGCASLTEVYVTVSQIINHIWLTLEQIDLPCGYPTQVIICTTSCQHVKIVNALSTFTFSYTVNDTMKLE